MRKLSDNTMRTSGCIRIPDANVRMSDLARFEIPSITPLKVDISTRIVSFWSKLVNDIENCQRSSLIYNILAYVYIMFPATTAAKAVRNVARRVIWSIFVLTLKFC